FTLRLNDESEEQLDPTSLYIEAGNVLYCRVKKQEYTARFLRPAYYQLTAYIEEDNTNGTFSLRVGTAHFSLDYRNRSSC
ncbi:MAG: hypothetical protein AB7G75_21630, partial [Candidatus Binatia bacterium]